VGNCGARHNADGLQVFHERCARECVTQVLPCSASLLSFRIVNDHYRARGGVVWKVREGEGRLFIRTLTPTRSHVHTRPLMNGTRLVTCDAGIDQTDRRILSPDHQRAISFCLCLSLSRPRPRKYLSLITLTIDNR